MRLLGGLLLITACGKQISIDHTALKNASALTKNTFKTGTVVRMSGSDNIYLQYNNSSYRISPLSSPIAQKFIKDFTGKQVSVKFKGDIGNSEIIVNEIYRQ